MSNNSKNKFSRHKLTALLLGLAGLAVTLAGLLLYQSLLRRELYHNATDQMLELLSAQRALAHARTSEARRCPDSLARSATQTAQQIFDDSSREYMGGSYNLLLLLVNAKGEILARQGNLDLAVGQTNLNEYLSSAAFDGKEGAENIQENMRLLVSDCVVMKQQGQTLLLSYTALETGGWYLVNLVPARFAEQDVRFLGWKAGWLVLLTLTACGVVTGYLVWSNYRQIAALSVQGRELRASAARYNLLAARSQDVIVEFDLKTGLVVHSENAGALAAPALRGTNFFQQVVERGIVHPADTGLLQTILDGTTETGEDGALDLRAKLDGGGYSWYHLQLVCVRDDDGRPWRILARGNNIDQQKQEQEWLHRQVQQDPLTKLYNKEATREAIERLLAAAPGGTHALMILDIDNFKSYNDTHGHIFGDQLLTMAACQLSQLFRDCDVVGRMGGDEFMICCRDIGGEENAARRADQVCGLFAQIGIQCQPAVSLTCSVGVALSPRDGIRFAELYEQADLALYRVKRGGKGSFTLANPGGQMPENPLGSIQL